MPRRLTGEVEV